MANLDLQGLIDEVLGMAKSQQQYNRDFAHTSAIDKREAYRLKAADEAIAAGKTHDFELEKQRLINTGGLNVQGAKSAGDLAVKEVENTGSLARQRLASNATVDAANIGLTGEKYKADRLVEAYQGKANDPDKLLNEWIKSGIVTDPEEILKMRKKLRAQTSGIEPTPDTDREFFTPDKPAMTPSPVVEPLPVLNPVYAPTIKQPTKQRDYTIAANVPLPTYTGPSENTLFTQNPIAKAYRTQTEQVDEVLNKRKRKAFEMGR